MIDSFTLTQLKQILDDLRKEHSADFARGRLQMLIELNETPVVNPCPYCGTKTEVGHMNDFYGNDFGIRRYCTNDSCDFSEAPEPKEYDEALNYC